MAVNTTQAASAATSTSSAARHARGAGGHSHGAQPADFMALLGAAGDAQSLAEGGLEGLDASAMDAEAAGTSAGKRDVRGGKRGMAHASEAEADAQAGTAATATAVDSNGLPGSPTPEAAVPDPRATAELAGPADASTTSLPAWAAALQAGSGPAEPRMAEENAALRNLAEVSALPTAGTADRRVAGRADGRSAGSSADEAKASSRTTASTATETSTTFTAARGTARVQEQAQKAHVQAQADARAQAQESRLESQQLTAHVAERAAQAQPSTQDAVQQLVAATSTVAAGGWAAERESVRGPQRRHEDGGTPAAAANLDGTTSRHALSADAPLPVAGQPIQAGSAALEDQMAAQVSYWLSQKTQNAEMTLDGQDGSPVQVSISMSGNEAQVAFRADQAATRDLLGSALPQLRDMLDQQGVVLAGVTVDSFAAASQGQAGGGDRESGGDRGGRSGGRQTLQIGEAAGPQRLGGARATGSTSGVDLYV